MTFCAAPSAAPQPPKPRTLGHEKRRLTTNCTTSRCSHTWTQWHTSATARGVSFINASAPLKHARHVHAQCDTKLYTHGYAAVSFQNVRACFAPLSSPARSSVFVSHAPVDLHVCRSCRSFSSVVTVVSRNVWACLGIFPCLAIVGGGLEC